MIAKIKKAVQAQIELARKEEAEDTYDSRYFKPAPYDAEMSPAGGFRPKNPLPQVEPLGAKESLRTWFPGTAAFLGWLALGAKRVNGTVPQDKFAHAAPDYQGRHTRNAQPVIAVDTTADVRPSVPNWDTADPQGDDVQVSALKFLMDGKTQMLPQVTESPSRPNVPDWATINTQRLPVVPEQRRAANIPDHRPLQHV